MIGAIFSTIKLRKRAFILKELSIFAGLRVRGDGCPLFLLYRL
jgi:hypothetical protein